MIRRCLLSALALGLVACSNSDGQGDIATNPSQSKSLPDGSYRMQQAQVIDQTGFGKPLTAYSIFIPAGWQTQGGIVWDVNNSAGCGKAATRVEWAAYSPDGVSYVQLLPEENWSGHNLPDMGIQQSCPNVTTMNVKDYLQWYVQRERPGARILDYRERPDLTKGTEQYNRTENNMAGQLRYWVEAGEVLIAYEMQGQDMRETIAKILFFTHNRMQGVMPGEIREFLTISALPGLAARAPHGQLDFDLTETIRRSLKAGPEWQARMNEHNRIINKTNAEGAAARHAIRMDTIKAVGEINQQTYDNRQASNDRIQEANIRSIRGVELYNDPISHEQVELPNTHNNIWRLKDDTFILTNDANFQPYRDLGLEIKRAYNATE